MAPCPSSIDDMIIYDMGLWKNMGYPLIPVEYLHVQWPVWGLYPQFQTHPWPISAARQVLLPKSGAVRCDNEKQMGDKGDDGLELNISIFQWDINGI